jgi:hypothetical protein
MNPKGTMTAPGHKHAFLSRQSCVEASEPDVVFRRDAMPEMGHVNLLRIRRWSKNRIRFCRIGQQHIADRNWRIVSFAAGDGQSIANPAVAD